VLLLGVAAGSVWYSALQHKPIVEAQLAPGVEREGRLREHCPARRRARKVALVDAGKDGSGGAILAALARRGSRANRSAPSSSRTSRGPHGGVQSVSRRASLRARERSLARRPTRPKVTRPLKDGDVADVGDLRVEVFAVPGHTPGSAVYLARGVLFFGEQRRERPRTA